MYIETKYSFGSKKANQRVVDMVVVAVVVDIVAVEVVGN